MTKLDEYQNLVRNAEGFAPGRIDMNALLGLFGEAGEVCEEFKKMFRDDKQHFPTGERHERIINELGDVCYYVAAVCCNLGISMEDVIDKNRLQIMTKMKANNQNRDNW